MIDVHELRPGNWIFLNKEWQKVDQVSMYGYVGLQGNLISNVEHDIYPIPLTGDILQKCGFIAPALNGLAYGRNINSSDELCWYVQDKFMRYQTQRSGFTRQLQHITNLHQLQNLYFFLTGKELSIQL